MHTKKTLIFSMLVALGAFPNVQAQTQSKSDEIVLKQEGLPEDGDDDILFIQEEKEEEQNLLKNSEIFSIALQSKNYEKIDEYIRKGFNLNKELYDGNTVAQISAFHKDVGFLNFIADRKANLTNLNKNGESILYWGASGKSVQYLEEARALLGKNFSTLMDKKTKNGRTPLHSAVLYSGNIDVISWLISNKVDIKAKDSNGQTAMHYAASIRRWDVLEHLLKNGGNINEVDNEGKSVEDYIFNNMDVLVIDKFYPYVSEAKKKYIENALGTIFPEKIIQYNPQYKLTPEQKGKIESKKEQIISGKEIIK